MEKNTWILVLSAVLAGLHVRSTEAEPSYKYMTAYMGNAPSEQARNELYITAYLSDTNVVVTFDGSPIKELSMEGGEHVTVELPMTTELFEGSGILPKAVMIESDKLITIVSVNRKTNSLDTSLVYPVTEWGLEYHIFTPSAYGYPKEFAVFASEDSSVAIRLMCPVTFEGKTYGPHDQLNAILHASDVLYLESPGGDDDCTGSIVISDKPVGVMSGHACAWKNSQCQFNFEQLPPVERWGQYFIVQPLEYQVLMDSVYIFAYKPTSVSYTVGYTSETIELAAGEWKEVQMDRTYPLTISATQHVQVIYYCTGGKFSDGTVFDPFIMNIESTDKFCESRTLEGLEGFTNYALIVAKTKDIHQVEFDDKRPTFNWKELVGTEFSYAHYTYDQGRSHHIMKSPGAPIGVYSVGTVDRNSYGAPAACGLLTCTYKGKSYLPGTRFWGSSDCAELCECNPATAFVDCQKSQCKDGEECVASGGSYGCAPKVVTPPAHEHVITAPVHEHIITAPVSEGEEGSGQENTVVTIYKIPGSQGVDMQGSTSVIMGTPEIVQSNNVITLTPETQVMSFGVSLEYPVSEWGQDYFVFTPSTSGFTKQIVIFSGPEASSASVDLSCTVNFRGNTYKPSEKLTVNLGASEMVQMQSDEDCTGSRVVSDKPVGVLSGLGCDSTNSICQDSLKQLLPVSQWGTSYIIPPIEDQLQEDSVTILTSEPTDITYQFGDSSQVINLSAGQWKALPMGKSTPLSISSTQPIQVLYYSNGGKFSDGSVFGPFIMNMVPTDKFCVANVPHDMDDLKNYALIVAKTKDVKDVMFDHKHPSCNWQEVQGTEYSWASYTYEKGSGHHIVMHPSAAIGVYTVGTAQGKSYGAPASCARITRQYTQN